MGAGRGWERLTEVQMVAVPVADRFGSPCDWAPIWADLRRIARDLAPKLAAATPGDKPPYYAKRGHVYVYTQRRGAGERWTRPGYVLGPAEEGRPRAEHRCALEHPFAVVAAPRGARVLHGSSAVRRAAGRAHKGSAGRQARMSDHVAMGRMADSGPCKVGWTSRASAKRVARQADENGATYELRASASYGCAAMVERAVHLRLRMHRLAPMLRQQRRGRSPRRQGGVGGGGGGASEDSGGSSSASDAYSKAGGTEWFDVAPDTAVSCVAMMGPVVQAFLLQHWPEQHHWAAMGSHAAIPQPPPPPPSPPPPSPPPGGFRGAQSPPGSPTGGAEVFSLSDAADLIIQMERLGLESAEDGEASPMPRAPE